VAVESLHLGHPTYYVDALDEIPNDHYGFQGAGILPDFSLDRLDSPETLIAPFDAGWRERFSYFDHTMLEEKEITYELIRNALCSLLSRDNGSIH
jgi:hypothetical protein